MTANTNSTTPGVDPNEECYSPIELATKLKVRKETIVNWLKDPSHPLQGYKLGNNLWRIPKSSVANYLRGVYGGTVRNTD